MKGYRKILIRSSCTQKKTNSSVLESTGNEPELIPSIWRRKLICFGQLDLKETH